MVHLTFLPRAGATTSLTMAPRERTPRYSFSCDRGRVTRREHEVNIHAEFRGVRGVTRERPTRVDSPVATKCSPVRRPCRRALWPPRGLRHVVVRSAFCWIGVHIARIDRLIGIR